MGDIHKKLAKVAGDIGSINKTERNKEQGFNFRSIEQITERARPLLAQEGISTAPRMLSLEHSEVTAKSGARGYRAVVVMEYTFTAGSDDSSITTSMPGEAVDYGDKSTSKAVQMAYKYALTQVLQVGSGDDPDAHSVDVGGTEEYKRPRSGGRKLTPGNRAAAPTPTEASQSHGNGAQKHLTADEAIQLGRIKRELLERVDGDKTKAMGYWTTALATFGLNPPDPIPGNMLGSIETALKAIEVTP